MKLVVDNENVEHLEIHNLQDVPAMLRGLADSIEAGEYGEVVSLFALIDTADNMFTEIFGDDLSRYECAGMLEFAKQRLWFDD